MLTTSTAVKHQALSMDPGNTHPGVSGVFAAAVVSRGFCQLLLSDPQRALRQGYLGKSFTLSAEDAALIVSINAESLPDLARKVVHTLSA